MAPTLAPTVLTKMIYLDTRTRLRVDVMLVQRLIHHHAQLNLYFSTR